MTERFDQTFSVFNMHINDAGKRADEEFCAQFGKQKFEEIIKPFYDDGVMSIFNEPPSTFTLAWVTLVTAYVNELR